jgi:hypothetical protein
MHDIYAVKIRNVTQAAVGKSKLRASYFPYERFYIFHEDDTDTINRMFHVYLLHRLSNPTLQACLNHNIDLCQIVTLGAVIKEKVSTVKEYTNSQSHIPWHIKDLDHRVLVVPSFSRKLEPSVSTKEDASVVGYVKSRYAATPIVAIIGELPDLIVNKENLQHPCQFCEQFFVGFQEGKCEFGGVVCRKDCKIFLPEKRLEISLGENLWHMDSTQQV